MDQKKIRWGFLGGLRRGACANPMLVSDGGLYGVKYVLENYTHYDIIFKDI